jgi:hypothetical protein
VKTGLISPGVTASTAGMTYVTFLSNCSFQSGKTCYYFYIFSIQRILFFLNYEVSLICLFMHFHFFMLIYP